jgi:hypothetical protein
VAVRSVLENAVEVGEEAGQGDTADVSLLAECLEPLVNVAVALGHAFLPEAEAVEAGVEQLIPRPPEPHDAA